MRSAGVIGLDLGGTKLSGALFTSQGRILERQVVTLGRQRGAAVGGLVREELGKLMAVAHTRGMTVGAIGVSVPGIAYGRTGKVWAPNIPGWNDYPLRRELLAAVARRRIPVEIDSDRACSILGETWRGAARGCRDAIFLAVGTGIGAGILSDGRILRGAHDIAGAIGWLALDRPFKPEYVGCGCFEYHASGEGLAKVANRLLRRKGLTASDVFAARDRGEKWGREVIGHAVQFWGMAVANLVSLFNPEMIIFGGGVFGPGKRFLREIYAEAVRWAQPISIRKVKLQLSDLGADAGLYGAGCLALQATKRVG